MNPKSVGLFVFLLLVDCSAVPSRDSTITSPTSNTVTAAQALAFADVDSPKSLYRLIDLDKSKPLKVTLEATTKGNGIITIPGLTVRVYDQHNDGVIFANDGELTCEWKSDPVSKYPLLMLSGVAIHYDEKGDNVIQRNNVSALFRYSATKRSYYAESCSPEIDYWNSN